VSPLEQVAFGWQCLLGSLRACRSPAIWGPWSVLFGLQALGVLALWWGAHPALSWAVAPLLRAIESDAALRYPELFRRLPNLARDVGLVTGALALPVLAGVSARLFEQRFQGGVTGAGETRAAWTEGLSRWGALLLVALPVTLAGAGLQGALRSLDAVRLSSLARTIAHPAADAVLLGVRVACAYSAALVVLGGLGGVRALARIPATWSSGLMPAAVALGLLAPAGILASAVVSASPAFIERGAPEWVVAAVLLRAAVGATLGMLASGAITLAWVAHVAESGGEA
jgi:hypothetical protein